jgi:toxin HigB-1
LDINFRRRKLERIFNAQAALIRTFGAPMAEAIMKRMLVLRSAQNLGQVPITPPDRRHQLAENRDEQFAVDLVHPKRLVFEVNHDKIPRKPDGGIEVDNVTAITIIEVVDYH